DLPRCVASASPLPRDPRDHDQPLANVRTGTPRNYEPSPGPSVYNARVTLRKPQYAVRTIIIAAARTRANSPRGVGSMTPALELAMSAEPSPSRSCRSRPG